MTAVGFTGTRGDLPFVQFDALIDVLAELDTDDTVETFHFGVCVGSDIAAAQVARNMGWRVHGWPPINQKFRAPLDRRGVNHAPMGYAQRNLMIVQHADTMLACPAGPEEAWPRSGTWQTVRIARRLAVPTLIIWPDGSTTHDA